MFESVLDGVSWFLMTAGGGFVLIGTLGLIRFPDVYSRMHATGMTDTLGAALFFAGLMVQGGFTLVTVKLALVLIFLLLTSPAATYAVANAAYSRGLEPVLGKPVPDDPGPNEPAPENPAPESPAPENLATEKKEHESS